MGADKLAENIPNAPKFICPNCLTKPKRLGFRWKKSSLDVRSPWATLYRQSDIAKFLLDIWVLYSIFGRPGGAILKAINVIKKRQIYTGCPSDLSPPSTILMAYQKKTEFFLLQATSIPWASFFPFGIQKEKKSFGGPKEKTPSGPPKERKLSFLWSWTPKESFFIYSAGPVWEIWK